MVSAGSMTLWGYIDTCRFIWVADDINTSTKEEELVTVKNMPPRDSQQACKGSMESQVPWDVIHVKRVSHVNNTHSDKVILYKDIFQIRLEFFRIHQTQNLSQCLDLKQD